MKNQKTKSNLKWWLIGAGVLILVLIAFGVGTYNRLIALEGGVAEKWANVETQYQRRIDLIPNLVSTVKGYATHERDLFTQITELRSQWANAKTVDAKINAAQGLESVVSKLLMVSEAYPQLKANENFLSLQDELAGTENRVAVERTRYNEAVLAYNVAIKRVPTNLLAGMFGFEPKSMFEAQAGAEKAPTVTF